MRDYGYSGSFKFLGYELKSPRNHWSAATETGVCLSLWSGEMRFVRGLPQMDTQTDCDPIETWSATGKTMRDEHLKLAWTDFNRWIDVVVRQGDADGDGVPTHPWVIGDRKNHKWRLQTFDEDTGHFSARAELFTG